MNILVNGVPTDMKSAELESALIMLGYADATVATAINGDFVPLSLRINTVLIEGDKLEILAPMQGG